MSEEHIKAGQASGEARRVRKWEREQSAMQAPTGAMDRTEQSMDRIFQALIDALRATEELNARLAKLLKRLERGLNKGERDNA